MKPLKAPLLQSLKTNSLPPGFLVLLLVLALILVLVLGGLGCFPLLVRTETAEADSPFETFRASRMALPETTPPVTLVAVGDVMLSRYVARVVREQADTGYPFHQVRWLLQSSDITLGNLENPLTPGREIKVPEMVLRADPEMASALYEAGFTVMSLANNHVPDFGHKGVMDTLYHLTEAGILAVGAGNHEASAYAPCYEEIRGTTFAFLSFCSDVFLPPGYAAESHPGVALIHEEKMTAAIAAAAEKADVVVVSLHAGTEYAPEPDDTQVQAARLAVDAGADLVIGTHPHVIQPYEVYQGKVIYHSLGNFVFDQLWSEETRRGLAVRFTLQDNQVLQVEHWVVFIDDDARPVIQEAWLEGEPVPPRRLFREEQADLNEDGRRETYSLRNGRLTVNHQDGRLLWQSPEEWWIDDFYFGDITNDGRQNLCLSVWREGSYGPYRPFWVDANDTMVRNHLFVYQMEAAGENGPEKPSLKAVWQSSHLARPNHTAFIAQIDEDGENHLVVVQGDYENPQAGEIAFWKWNGWGFSPSRD